MYACALELRPPSNASPNQPVILTALACPGLGSCVAVGVYADKTDRSSAFAAAESAAPGTRRHSSYSPRTRRRSLRWSFWTRWPAPGPGRASRLALVPVPPDGATGRKQDSIARGIGCTAAAFCAIAGTYQTALLATRLMAAIS